MCCSTGAPPCAALVLSRIIDGGVSHSCERVPACCRNIKGFILQTGDPSGTGKGGASIWGKHSPDEFHATLRVRSRSRPG
jgi:hypothetical protein